MHSRYLLDTNICIYIHRQKPEEVLLQFNKLKPGDAAISVITWGELIHGAEKSRHRKQVLLLLEEFTALIPVLPLPENAGEKYGAIRAFLESKGTPIGNNDLWIAAHAKSEGMILVTNNEREFKRIPGLNVRNWVHGS
ncbi:MAG: type II toxin-antitoxin system VapC family toxin [Pseudomonadota bacterium]